MSTLMRVSENCAICGKKIIYNTLGSTNSFGATDLDSRPPEMMRSTMSWWLKECERCGYVSTHLSYNRNITRKWLKSEKYTSCDERDFESDLAKRFYKYYLINLETEDPKKAFYAALHTAWCCDDQKDTDNAIHCRECALVEIEKIIPTTRKSEDLIIIKADLLRRTGQFEAVIEEYQGKSFSKDLSNKIIAFQIERAKAKDTACYTVDDAIGDF